MTKSERKAQAVRDMKEGLRTGNYNLMINSGKTLYNYLSKEEKKRMNTFVDPIAKKRGEIKEEYAKALIDSLQGKANRKVITAEDIKHASRNIEQVKSAELRSAELVLKTWRSPVLQKDKNEESLDKKLNPDRDKYFEFVRKSGLYKNKGPRKISEIAKNMNYKGGSKKEGYTFTIKVKGVVWEIQTPGYDEEKGSLHGFRFRELGQTKWQ